MSGEPEKKPEGETPNTDTQPDKSGSEGKLHTQAEIDRIVQERLKRERETLTSKFFADLGVENADALKAIVNAKKEADDKEKTALQLLQDKYTALEKIKADLETQVSDLTKKQREGTRDSAILNALRDAKANKVDDLLILMKTKHSADIASVLGEDDVVKEDVLKRLVTTAKTSHGEYFTPAQPGSPSNRNGNVTDINKPDSNAMAMYRRMLRSNF